MGPKPPVSEAAKRLSASKTARDRIIADPNLTQAENRRKVDELQVQENALAKMVMATRSATRSATR